ncbi:EthD domain-containing protein [Aspergillus recurvatus]
MSASGPPATNSTTPEDRLLCLTILGYRKPGMSEEAYRKHMIEHSAPLTKDLMVKYGILRWTVIHNPTETRELMYEIMDPQMANIADYDCFSQVVFRNFEDYKKIKDDPWYKEHLVGDHENFADTRRSKMTIGWITQFIDRGVVTEGFEGFPEPKK